MSVFGIPRAGLKRRYSTAALLNMSTFLWIGMEDLPDMASMKSNSRRVRPDNVSEFALLLRPYTSCRSETLPGKRQWCDQDLDNNVQSTFARVIMLAVAFCAMTGWSHAQDKLPPGTRTEFVTTTDRVRIHYFEAGHRLKSRASLDGPSTANQQKPAILFVPGWMTPGWIWEHQVAHFRRTTAWLQWTRVRKVSLQKPTTVTIQPHVRVILNALWINLNWRRRAVHNNKKESPRTHWILRAEFIENP
jgi:hypothetical protein